MQTKLYMRSIALLIALASTSAFAQDYASPYGEWRGQTQYQAFIGTTSDPAAHIVTGLTVVIDAQGKVVGISTENGCRLLGIAAPGITPTILNLDVTLTGCKYAGLNRTYKGYLSVYQGKIRNGLSPVHKRRRRQRWYVQHQGNATPVSLIQTSSQR